MGNAEAFILQKYTVVETLKESALGRTELVLGRDQRVYVRKCIYNPSYPVEAVRGLQHKHLSHIVHAVHAEDKVYLIEEYFEGESLAVLLKKKGNLPEQAVIDIAQQICEALQYLHQHNLVHRDVKPGNILRQGNGQIRLIDLGSVRLCTTHEAGDTMALGTMGYAAPEQYGLESTDFRADIYALGVTIQTLLGPNYKGSLHEVIDGCTRFMRGYRYDSIAKVKRALFYAKYHRCLRLGLLSLLVAGLSLGAYYYFRPAYENNLPEPKPVEKTVPSNPVTESKVKEVEVSQEAKPTETRDKQNAEHAAKAQAERTKPIAPPKVAPEPPAKLQLEVKGANLKFYKIFGHPSDKELIDEAKAKGAWPISSNSSNAEPYWEIITKGALINPIFTFQFHGIAFNGIEMQYSDVIGQKKWSLDNPGGWSTRVRLAETGTMDGPMKIYLANVHKWFWFTNVTNPKVTVTVQADNAVKKVVEFPITILDL